MQTFCIVGHIKKYAKVQRYLEDWEEAGDIVKHRGLLQHLHKKYP